MLKGKKRMRTGRHLRSVNMMTGWPGLVDRAAPTAFIEETETLDFGLLCPISEMCAPMANNNLFSGNGSILILFSKLGKVSPKETKKCKKVNQR